MLLKKSKKELHNQCLKIYCAEIVPKLYTLDFQTFSFLAISFFVPN